MARCWIRVNMVLYIIEQQESGERKWHLIEEDAIGCDY